MPVVTARAPTRLDFGGGWTDVPPYSHEQGGFVCNLAIARYATVRVEPASGASSETLSPHSDEGALASAVMRRVGAGGLSVHQVNDFPVKAGLGGSSAAGVAMYCATIAASPLTTGSEHGLDLSQLDRSALAEASRRVEVEDLGIAGGRQDHYAAAYGGALALTFGDTTRVRRIPLTRELIAALRRRLVVVYTGESRISRDTITAVLDAYEGREGHVVEALAAMQQLAREMATALEQCDVDSLGTLVGDHWVHQRSLHHAITTPRIDAILTAGAKAGALGGKALGASGGGCVLLIAADGRERDVRAAVSSLSALVEIDIDEHGVCWWTGDQAPDHFTHS